MLFDTIADLFDFSSSDAGGVIAFSGNVDSVLTFFVDFYSSSKNCFEFEGGLSIGKGGKAWVWNKKYFLREIVKKKVGKIIIKKKDLFILYFFTF